MNDEALFAAMQTASGTDLPDGDWGRLGAALHAGGQAEAALAAFESAVALNPEVLAFWHALAALRLELKLPQAAWSACESALRLDPGNMRTLFNSAVVKAENDDDEGARVLYERVLELNPNHHDTLCNLPHLLWRLAPQTEAIAMARRAVATYPDDAWFYLNLGDLQLGAIDGPAAEASFEQALKLDPDLHQARYALSIALAMQSRIADAYLARNAALAAEPELATEYVSPLAMDLLKGENRPTPERIHIQLMFEKMYASDWRDREKMAHLFSELVQGLHGTSPLSDYDMPHLALVLPVDEATRREVARNASRRACAAVYDLPLLRPQRPPDGKIRIGYLSADFSPHPTAWLLGDMFSRHDHERFTVHAYSVAPPVECAERERVKRDVDEFHDIHAMPAHAAAQLIANHCIDILVDLSGFTRNTKPEILALHPAAVQVSYKGFMGTQGAPYMDYVFLDHVSLTEAARPYWDEHVAWLPHCSHHCELPQTQVPAPSRKSIGLPPDKLVLCMLHSPIKIDPYCFSIWMELAHELPETVLWFYADSDDQAANLRREAENKGIAAERLIFSSPLAHDGHLARYRLADICLDTFVYNGHTTTAEALGMGAPVVTLTGETVCGRLATSMLVAHGLPELVATTVAEYKAIVHRLARDAEWRTEIRRRVGDYAGSKLFNSERRIREIESAYEMMWVRHQSGQPPEDFDVPEWQE